MPSSRNDDYYSSPVGVIFLFNLIVGTGALALPSAVQRGGWMIGICLLLVLGTVSFITVTFIVESLAIANAVSRKRYGESVVGDEAEEDRQSLIPSPSRTDSDDFVITEKYEIGQMGVLMTPKWCQIVIYASLCIYLFGDLAIYAVVLGTTLAKVICRSNAQNETNPTLNNGHCWVDSNFSVLYVYRLSIVGFILLVGPFVFFNLQKTKILQIITGIMRWVAFFIMIMWSLYDLYYYGVRGYPPLVEPKFLPALFGTSVYSFMCQHSIPGLLFPIRNKSHIKFILPIDYSLITVFYLFLTLTAIFSFEQIDDIYTLNFWGIVTGPKPKSIFLNVLAYYLALYPIFTLGTNYPLLAITLKNNFRSMILRDVPKKWYYDRLVFPLVTILPPTALALGVSDLHMLFGIIGSYCGTCVQYLVPCLLVTFARYQAESFDSDNKFASPFKSKYWVYAVYIWMAISLVCITLNYIHLEK